MMRWLAWYKGWEFKVQPLIAVAFGGLAVWAFVDRNYVNLGFWLVSAAIWVYAAVKIRRRDAAG